MKCENNLGEKLQYLILKKENSLLIVKELTSHRE